jgi:hypothetical protein
MPATEPDEPELPLWPEPGTKHGSSAASSPARDASAASPTPPADVLPVVQDRPGPAPRPIPPTAEPSWWDDQARRRQYDRGELRASGDRLGLARESPVRTPGAGGPPAGGTRSRLLTTRFVAEGLRRLGPEPGTAPEREGGT